MKKIVSLILALVMCFSLSATALAEAIDTPEEEEVPVAVIVTGDQPNAEETKWYYRVVDNYYVQRRLWSLTYGYWKTDWETIGYINP